MTLLTLQRGTRAAHSGTEAGSGSGTGTEQRSPRREAQASGGAGSGFIRRPLLDVHGVLGQDEPLRILTGTRRRTQDPAVQ